MDSRTKQAVARRRNIADAANGSTCRARVILYACLPVGSHSDEILASLRIYARARDWDVAAELVERAPIAEPMESRECWTRVRSMIEDREAEGIVVPLRRTLGYRPCERDKVNTWLAHNHAWVVAIHADPECTEVGP